MVSSKERRTRGGRAHDRSGVHKVPTVRMFKYELTKFRMYESKWRWNRNVLPTNAVGRVRMSKIRDYESPYIVKGNIKHVGL